MLWVVAFSLNLWLAQARFEDIGVFDRRVFTHPHTFFTPIASLRISKVNMVMRPAQLQNVYRAHLHALPARLALPAMEADILRFEPVLK
jgi:hypothetical protein